MPTSSSQGLLAIWADVDAEYTTEFRQWHNCEHIPERVNISGFHVGHRYRGMTHERDFFMVYETDTADVMKSPPYLHSQNNPTPWTRQSVSRFRNALRTIYRLVAEAGTCPALDAPYLLLVRANPPQSPDGSADVIRWYQDEHLPRLCAIEGVHRGRLYHADPVISNIETTERNVHGATIGTQTFLAMYELASPTIPDSATWAEAARGTPRSATMVAALQNLERESYWLDFALQAPIHP